MTNSIPVSEGRCSECNSDEQKLIFVGPTLLISFNINIKILNADSKYNVERFLTRFFYKHRPSIQIKILQSQLIED
jgi:uncharacterized protein (UPF0212 family)